MKKSSYRIFLLLFDEGIRRENFFSYSWSYSFLLSVPGPNAKKVFRRFRRTLPVHGSTSFSIIRTFFCPFFSVCDAPMPASTVVIPAATPHCTTPH